MYPEVLDDPAKGLKNLAFLSPEMLDAVKYAQAEGRRLGLRIDVTLCSGWPYGGPATTLSEAVTRLRIAEVAVPANATSVATPTLEEGETLLSATLVHGTPILRRAADRRPRGTGSGKHLGCVDCQVLQAQRRNHDRPCGEHAAGGGVLHPEPHQPAGEARGGGCRGLRARSLQQEAVATHLKTVGEPLVKAFGATPPYAIFSDSLEAYGADWTPTLPAEFRKRRGYDLMPHLPELVAGGSPAADKVRHDYGRTLTELVNENYLIADQRLGQGARHEVPLADLRRAGGQLLQRSAWSRCLKAKARSGARSPRCAGRHRANHVFGNNVTSGETFTWLHSPVFRATPLDMKAEADIDFIMGENQLIFHGWPYSPPDREVPRARLEPLRRSQLQRLTIRGIPVMPAVNQYIARISFLLRQGEPANQVAILLPTDDAWASFSPGHTTVTGALQKLITPELMATILSAGYNVDFIDADAIDKVGFGTHQIVVIPPTDRIPVATLRKLDDWVTKHGGKAIAVGRAPSMDPDGNTPAELKKLLAAAAVCARRRESWPRSAAKQTAPDLRSRQTRMQAQRLRSALSAGSCRGWRISTLSPTPATAPSMPPQSWQLPSGRA